MGELPFEAREPYFTTVMLEFMEQSVLQQFIERSAFSGMMGKQAASDKGITKFADMCTWCAQESRAKTRGFRLQHKPPAGLYLKLTAWDFMERCVGWRGFPVEPSPLIWEVGDICHPRHT